MNELGNNQARQCRKFIPDLPLMKIMWSLTRLSTASKTPFIQAKEIYQSKLNTSWQFTTLDGRERWEVVLIGTSHKFKIPVKVYRGRRKKDRFAGLSTEKGIVGFTLQKDKVESYFSKSP